MFVVTEADARRGAAVRPDHYRLEAVGGVAASG
jgi:hypothetical protein